jgi:hypothetical protein
LPADRRLLLCLALTLPLSGCPEEDRQQVPRKMAMAKEQDALSFMQHFFDAYVHVDVDSVSRMICEQDPQSLGQVRAFIQHSQAEDSPFRVARYQVRSAVPMWIGKEPYFRVEVSFPRKAGRGEILHQYRVRVRDGCVEGLLEPGPGPRPSPPPVGSGVERSDEDAPIELLDDENPSDDDATDTPSEGGAPPVGTAPTGEAPTDAPQEDAIIEL